MKNFVITFLVLILCFMINEEFFNEDVEPEPLTRTASYSLDWSSEDNIYLLKTAEYHGGTVEDRAYTIRVALNRVHTYKQPIPMTCNMELFDDHGITLNDWENIIPSQESRDALDLILLEKFDNSNGSLEFKEKEAE